MLNLILTCKMCELFPVLRRSFSCISWSALAGPSSTLLVLQKNCKICIHFSKSYVQMTGGGERLTTETSHHGNASKKTNVM